MSRSMNEHEQALHEKIRQLTQQITETEDLLTHRVLRERLNSLKQEREALLQELGQITAGRESRRLPVDA